MRNNAESPDRNPRTLKKLVTKQLTHFRILAKDVEQMRISILGATCSCPHGDDKSCANSVLNELRKLPTEQLWEAVQALDEDDVRRGYMAHMDCSWLKEIGE